jgi:hypothetical protein
MKSRTKLEKYLTEHGFSGSIPLNGRSKNYHAIKQLVAGDAFYTFGIKEIAKQAKQGLILRNDVRRILVDASGLTVNRFRWLGPGYFDPAKSAAALLAARDRLQLAAERRQRVAFATGHPGAMVGFYSVLADWAARRGARLVTIDEPIVVSRAYCLDMIGPVFAASDNASNWHTHETRYMEALLDRQKVDLVVGDHGFVGGALNHDIECIGFYDTDDPALPLAQSLGLPILSVPINDNCYNLSGSQLARLLLELEGA